MKNEYFDNIYSILENSFEPFLHRGYQKQKELLDNEKYNLLVSKENEEILGFLSYWEIEPNLLFVEHFAVNKEKRGKGIGKTLFKDFLKLDGDKILEVEPPHTEIDKKRIKLYESFGFIFHEHEYYQPPYNIGDTKTRLHIMCSKKLDNITFSNIVKKLYKNVYKVDKV